MESEHIKTNVFSISGMRCFSCVKTINNALKKQKGIVHAQVDLNRAEAVIGFDTSLLQKDQISKIIEAEGYQVKNVNDPLKTPVKKEISDDRVFKSPGPYINGGIAFFAIIGFYLGLLTLVSDWYFATVQFEEFRVWILLLATGLGIQVFLYSNLRLFIRKMKLKGAGKTVVVSGGLSTAGMAACCAHYLLTVLPVFGVPLVSAGIAALERYQTVFFLIGVLSNLIGIIYMLNLMKKNRMIAFPDILNRLSLYKTHP